MGKEVETNSQFDPLFNRSTKKYDWWKYKTNKKSIRVLENFEKEEKNLKIQLKYLIFLIYLFINWKKLFVYIILKMNNFIV